MRMHQGRFSLTEKENLIAFSIRRLACGLIQRMNARLVELETPYVVSYWKR